MWTRTTWSKEELRKAAQADDPPTVRRTSRRAISGRHPSHSRAREVGSPPIPRPWMLRYCRGVNISEAVRGTVLERIKRLDRTERVVIMHASVIGRRFDLRVLLAASGLAEESVRRALERACRLQLIVAERDTVDRFAFRHALTRDIVYGDFVTIRTRPLHRRIVQALEATIHPGGPPLEDLAYHAWAGGDGQRAVRYNERAGDHAAAVHALDDARTYYIRARMYVGAGSPAYERLTEKVRALADR
jgi:predicted ATPase